MTSSSNGSAASAISIGTPVELASRSTRFWRCDAAVVARREERPGKLVFAAELAQEGDVDIESKPGLAPSKDCQAADEAKLPALCDQEGFEVTGGFEKRAQRHGFDVRRRAKYFCCSVSPEVGFAGGSSTAAAVSNRARMAACVSMTSSSRWRSCSSS